MQECRETTRNRVYPSVIILSPTRELAIQLWEATRKLILGTHLNSAVVHGGTPLAEQVSLEEGRARRGSMRRACATTMRWHHLLSVHLMHLMQPTHSHRALRLRDCR